MGQDEHPLALSPVLEYSPLLQHDNVCRVILLGVLMYAASSGRYTASSAEQPLNALSTMVTVLLQLTCTEVSDVHESNAKLEIDATLHGIIIDLRPENAKVEFSRSEITEPG